MWAYYGQNHTGVALKYKTDFTGNRISLQLYGVNGFGGAKDNIKPTFEYQTYAFEEIRYGKIHPSIDFFRSLRLPVPSLMEDWYSDEQSQTSICGQHLTSDINLWRKEYWDRFLEIHTSKHSDWAHEQEYRLIIDDDILDRTESSRRKLKYDFSSLDGIVFGVRTSQLVKMRIIEIIERKCRLEERSSFNFYQARYSPKLGKINVHKLDLMKFDGT